jgi:GTP-binding protein YchF
MKCGIVGLPNVGKSTLFNCLTSVMKAEVANYPFCTIEPNSGVVPVPDKRFDELVKLYKPAKSVKAVVEFVDIAGLVAGASKGEGLGNQFLSHIREVDAIVHVVRCFEDQNILHVYDKVDPSRDIEIIETELILKDLETVGKRIDRYEKLIKSNDKKIIEEYGKLLDLRKHLESGRLAKYFMTDLVKDGKNEIYSSLKSLELLTDKHVLYVANVDDKSINGNSYSKIVEEIAAKENEAALIISAGTEAQLINMEYAERQEFIKELGLSSSGLDKLIRTAYELLELITFFTVGPKEVHAWTVTRGTKAPEAAGKIHTDFEKGFIRAEVMSAEDLIRLGSENVVKEKGLMRLEGRNYTVNDGDVIYFRFNV